MRRFALAACVLAAGCVEVDVSGTGGTLQSGRSVGADSDRAFRAIKMNSVGPDTESIEIGTFSPRRILVRPTAIEVDGRPVATIDEATKDVLVEERNGRLLIAADGATVYDAKF